MWKKKSCRRVSENGHWPKGPKLGESWDVMLKGKLVIKKKRVNEGN